MIITAKELRILLKIQGVETELTDEELEILIDYKTKEISGYIGFDIENTVHTHHEFKFEGDEFLLLHYPVSSISYVLLNDVIIPSDQYKVDLEYGILLFSSYISGELIIEYRSILPKYIISNLIIPLLVDMIIYVMKHVMSIGDVTSMSEGGISVHYNNNSTIGNNILNRLQELRNYLGGRLRVI